jgi:DNA repair protein RadC
MYVDSIVMYSLKDTNIIVTSYKPTSSVREYILRVKDMPSDEKPREKLLKHGPGALSVNELLAVILSTGTKKEGVMEMTSRILKEYGDRTIIGTIDAKDLAQSLDIPVIKALQIVATGELGKRFYEKKEGSTAILRTARDVFEYVKDMRDLPKEHLRGIYLNTHHKVVHDETISIGTLNSSLIHPREVFRPAVEYSAVAVILVHNHPSGVVTPSQADIDVTKQLVHAGKIMGIHLVDHVIVAKDTFASVDVEY